MIFKQKNTEHGVKTQRITRESGNWKQIEERGNQVKQKKMDKNKKRRNTNIKKENRCT